MAILDTQLNTAFSNVFKQKLESRVNIVHQIANTNYQAQLRTADKVDIPTDTTSLTTADYNNLYSNTNLPDNFPAFTNADRASYDTTQWKPNRPKTSKFIATLPDVEQSPVNVIAMGTEKLIREYGEDIEDNAIVKLAAGISTGSSNKYDGKDTGRLIGTDANFINSTTGKLEGSLDGQDIIDAFFDIWGIGETDNIFGPAAEQENTLVCYLPTSVRIALVRYLQESGKTEDIRNVAWNGGTVDRIFNRFNLVPSNRLGTTPIGGKNYLPLYFVSTAGFTTANLLGAFGGLDVRYYAPRDTSSSGLSHRWTAFWNNDSFVTDDRLVFSRFVRTA